MAINRVYFEIERPPIISIPLPKLADYIKLGNIEGKLSKKYHVTWKNNLEYWQVDHESQ